MNIIIKFYYYCFYRLTNAYKVLDETDPELASMAIVTLCQSLNILSFIAIPFIMSDSQYSKGLVVVVITSNFIINWFFILTKKKYIQLKDYWKNENTKNKKLKLYLIWVYILFSFVVYSISLYTMLK